MNIASFLTYTLLAAYTPGPNNIMALGNASRDGFRRTLPFLAGVLVGFTVVMGLCALLTSLLFRLIPAVEPYLLAAGAGYLVYLAWTIWRDRPRADSGQGLRANAFLAGAALQLVNVKIMLYGVTALASFVLPFHRAPGPLAGFSLLLAGIGLSGTVTWAVFGSLIEPFFHRRRRLVNGTMAVLLLYCAASLYVK